jgi:hypothetical protein
MNKIPTAEEFLLKIEEFHPEHIKNKNTIDYKVKQKLIEFAKLHVEAALKEAAETNYSSEKANFELVNKSILNSYPLSNIK